MRELLRRAALVLGVGWGLWLVMWSPEALFRVEAVDFAERYQRAYEKIGGRRAMGAVGAAREFIREHTNTGSVEKYRERTLENRRLRPVGETRSWFERVARAGGVWMSASDPEIAQYFDQIRAIRAVWLVSYLPTEISPNHFLEIRWETEPRESKAPRQMVYPYRTAGFAWMATGLVVYLLLHGRRPGAQEAYHDRAMLAALDGVAIIFFGVIFWFPLYLADSAGEAWQELAGGTGFFWSIAAPFLLLMIRNARAAAVRVEARDGVLRLSGLGGAREVPLSAIVRVEPLEKKGEAVGLRLHLASGPAVQVDWSSLVNVEPVRRALQPWLEAREAPAPGVGTGGQL